MRYTEVAWDFDGTLYQSYPHIINSLRRAVNKFGYDTSDEEINKYVRIRQNVAIRHFAPMCGCTPEQLGYWFHQYVYEITDDVALYPGLKELLRDIVAAGGRNHLCTNRSAETAEPYFIRDGIRPYFDCLSGALPGVRCKPEPDLVLRILEHTGASPDRLIMIGDRAIDHDASHAAGGVGCFFDPDGYLTEFPDTEYRAADVDELRRILLG